MKKIIISLLAFSLMLSACKKTLEQEFPNPEVYSKTGNLFPGMWTKMLYAWKLYIQDYGEWWWEIAGTGGMGVSAYTQVSERYITDRYAWFSNYGDLSGSEGFGSEGKLYNDRLPSYYNELRNWAVIKDKLSEISGQELSDNEIYYSLATVLKDYGALLMVDFYNDIPFSEAFKGKERLFFPKYDSAAQIYKTCLDDFKKISEELPSLYSKMSESAKSNFAVQDIAFKGNINSWVQYLNALRLKFAVRISGVEEAFAKSHIQDVIAKNNFPAADQYWFLPEPHDVKNGGTWLRGLNEAWPGTFIPNVIMKRMNLDSTLYQPGIDDPRLPVIAMPTKFSHYDSTIKRGDYRGVSMDADGQKPAYVAGERYNTSGPTGDLRANLRENSRSMYSFITYTLNTKFPVYMMSRAETDLFLAEVALKGLASTGKTAGDHIKDALKNSTSFWYDINALSPAAVDSILLHPKLSATAVETYANNLVSRFNQASGIEGKMEILMQQKYIHHNLLNPYELWAEWRRTRHPLLEPMTFQSKVMKPVPERLRYPTSEQQTNKENYEKVRAQDNFTSPIFWVPADKRSVVPYMNGYNYQ